MHEMQTIVTDVCSVCQSVLSCGSINMPSLCRFHSVQPLLNHFGLTLGLLCCSYPSGGCLGSHRNIVEWSGGLEAYLSGQLASFGALTLLVGSFGL